MMFIMTIVINNRRPGEWWAHIDDIMEFVVILEMQS